MSRLRIGILAFQGAIEEHEAALRDAADEEGLDIDVIWTKTGEDAERIHGLVIPGGESTVMGMLSAFNMSLHTIRKRAKEGLPIMGTCAGLIMMGSRTYDRVVGETGQPLLGVMDLLVERNSFGRQRESFEIPLDIPKIGKEKFKGVFIRSPSIKEVGEGVEVLCKLDETIVGAQQGQLIGLAFHPELSGDGRLHRHFLKTLISSI